MINIEKGTFTPLVFSTSGGMATEAAAFLKQVAEKITMTTQQRYSEVISFLRRRIRFDILKTCLIALRGYRGKRRSNNETPLEELEIELIQH